MDAPSSPSRSDRPLTRMPDAARELADDIDSREMSAKVFERVLHEVFPGRADDQEFLAALEQSVTDNVEAVLDVIAGRLRITSAEPLGAIALMDVLARLGEPTGAVERGYRIGQWEIWEQWVNAAQQRTVGRPDDLIELLLEPIRTLFKYIDTVLIPVLGRYEEQRREMDRAREHQRSRILREILDGAREVPAAEASAMLRYDVGLSHRAVILQSDDRRVAEQALERLRQALGAADALLHLDAVTGWAMWFGRLEPPTDQQQRAFRRELDALGLVGGVGETASDLAGLRLSHRQARQAAQVGEALGPDSSPVTWFADVQLEALLLGDGSGARAFVESILGPLAADDARSTRLRETLSAWIETGSHVGTAALLEIHEHTVRNRLRQAEDLLGATLPARRTELAVALRLHRSLG